MELLEKEKHDSSLRYRLLSVNAAQDASSSRLSSPLV